MSETVLDTLERLARHAALERRLKADGCSHHTLEAIRRESEALMAKCGMTVEYDERGDTWLTLNGQPLLFLGYDAEFDRTNAVSFSPPYALAHSR
jgi:hypothetical protein